MYLLWYRDGVGYMLRRNKKIPEIVIKDDVRPSNSSSRNKNQK